MEKDVLIGGLMRCCTSTLGEFDDSNCKLGDIVNCKHCDESMILIDHNGVDTWAWKNENPTFKL